MAHVPDIAVAAVDLVGGRRDWDVAFFRIGDRIMSRLDLPFAPRGDDLELWSKSFVGQFESDLVVAFARAPVGNSIGAFRQRYFNLTFRQKRSANRSAEQVLALVHRAGFHKGPKVFGYEIISKVFDITLGCARTDRPFLQAVESIVLADVAGHRDDFTPIVFLEPGNDDRRVEPS